MDWRAQFDDEGKGVLTEAVRSLFGVFESLCEGAIAVDRQARVVWINDKYRALLGIPAGEQVIGKNVEDVIPESLLRQVLETGKPILLDIMRFGDRSFVVTRIPLRGPDGDVHGAIGFVLYDRLELLKPLVAKFEKLYKRLQEAERELAAQRRSKYTLSQFVGAHPLVIELKRLARRAAQLDTTVLILGETGTGKELLAQAVHECSVRGKNPFVAINVSAIPETLLEAEFFGVARGAYTGADAKGRDGKFKLADGGTLFLDEIGDMPLQLQAKLLRVLQEQEIERVGSNEVVRIDVRVIAATSRNLDQLVQEGKFRADLYYRLNVLPITTPPLREHSSDLGQLCEIILEQIAIRTGLPLREVDESALGVLARHDWPGNVRELRNVLERACLLSDQPVLREAEICTVLPSTASRPAVTPRVIAVRHLDDVVADAERDVIRLALRLAKGNKAQAARLLGISRARLYDRITQLRVEAEEHAA